MPSVEGLATITYVDENKVTVDAELSVDSESPVQNMIVTMAIDEVNTNVNNLNARIGETAISDQLKILAFN